MATKKTKILKVKTGTYKKDGQDRNRYEEVGAIFTKDDGGTFMMIKRTFNPGGVPNPDNSDMLIVSMFDPIEDDGNGGGQQQATGSGKGSAKPKGNTPPVGDGDEIPF